MAFFPWGPYIPSVRVVVAEEVALHTSQGEVVEERHTQLVREEVEEAA